jgi:phosphotransferase system enzyme I (PtsP)
MRLVGERPIVFRLLDIGGDKVVPYMRSMAEENPAMGWRSLRLALDRPALLRTQVRALLQATNGKALRLLVPMVTETIEFLKVKRFILREIERLPRLGFPKPETLEIGAMIEVPSLLFELDRLLPETDFISIGSNDLIQFLTAADRANPRVARNYDAIARPRLRALKLIVDAAGKYNKPVTMCGELAGRAIEAMALLSIGMTRLSMGASSVGPIKEMILGLDLAALKAEMSDYLDNGDTDGSARELLIEFAERHSIPV